jgi:hypothetical protein
MSENEEIFTVLGPDGPTIQIWFDRVSSTCGTIMEEDELNPNIADACRLDPMLADPAYSRNRLTGCIIIQRLQSLPANLCSG